MDGTYMWYSEASTDFYMAYGNMHGQTVGSSSEPAETIVLEINTNEIVIPPTLKEFYSGNVTSNVKNMQNKIAQSTNFMNTEGTMKKTVVREKNAPTLIRTAITSGGIDTDDTPPSLVPITFTIDTTTIINNNNSHITILGRDNLTGVINKTAFEEAIAQSTNHQVEYVN